MKIGYMVLGPRTPTEKEQAAFFEDMECDTVYTDRLPDRDYRDLMLSGAAIRPGDELYLATPFLIGNGTPDTTRVVLALGKMGVSIAVAGCEKRVYDTEEMARKFAAVSVKKSRKVNAIMTAALGKGGRPAKWVPTVLDISILWALWSDRNVPLQTLLKVAELLAGYPVGRVTLTKMLGPRKAARFDDGPPQQSKESDDG